ncbi:MAG: alpha/beta fold hydrolase, partial [Actinobacteria bacterium]|nr:alpha/beta fold hydrolase [Actinomycetota bacterium]
MPPPDPSVVRIDGPWRHLQVHANGIRFHVVEGESSEPDHRNADGSSNAERPLVILLHGFASFWYSWRHQLRDLRGARVVAVDLRGYGGSDKPPTGYDGWTLAGDTAGLVRALGHNSAVLVGHADGGLVCWATAMLHPRAVRGIALVSSPHPMALRSSTLTDRGQRAALLPAMLRNQVPWWPEHVLTR